MAAGAVARSAGQGNGVSTATQKRAAQAALSFAQGPVIMGRRFCGDDGDHSIFSPALRITGFQRSASWATKALKASASIGAMIMPSWRMRPLLSGCAMPALITALTLRTMLGESPAGPARPNQLVASSL